MKERIQELRESFQKVYGSMEDIPINGLHAEYILWLENLCLTSAQSVGNNEGIESLIPVPCGIVANALRISEVSEKEFKIQRT